MAEHLRGGGKLPPIQVSRQNYLHDGRHRLAAHHMAGHTEIDAQHDSPEWEAEHSTRKGFEETELTITKAVEDGLESSLLALYRQLPSRAMAEVAVQGCGTCDDYVTHLVRERQQSATVAMLKLQTILDKAFELNQKDALQKGGTMPDKDKELPKETDGDEKVRKALEERIVALEKQVAELSGVKKESAGFSAASIGDGQPPLAGGETHAPDGVDMTTMSTTKESFAKDEAEAIVKLIKSGHTIQGYQKGTPEMPPKTPSSPAGVQKELFEGLSKSQDPNVKNVLGWAQK